ncbi:CvpA family protein [Sphingomonas arantia]|uniref:CvpA family protein n=1 Tax=Sphingomonas arantia TaxID=1460676 RepID=A0ABW4TVB9_9SPHN
MPALTALDIVVILLVGGGAVLGILRGFVTEVLSLFAWVAAILALKFFHPALAELLVGPVGTRAGASVLAFALIFLVVFAGGKLVARALGRRTRQSVLGPLDRLLGFGFGALKGLIGATLLFLAVTLVYDTLYGGAATRPDWIRDSRSYSLLNASGKAIVDYVAARRKLDPKPATTE